ALEPMFTQVAEQVVAGAIDRGGAADAVGLGAQFAVRASSGWLGWPESLEAELLDWVRANWEATRSGEFARTAAVAAWYNAIIAALLNTRRNTPTDDVTSELMNDAFLGRALTEEEITSILRNWTGGDLGSMALCVGVVLAYLADHPDLQHQLRSQEVTTARWHRVIDEILRLDDPFVANRRVATRDVMLDGEQISAGERLHLNWTAANLDPAVFDRFAPEAHAVIAPGGWLPRGADPARRGILTGWRWGSGGPLTPVALSGRAGAHLVKNVGRGSKTQIGAGLA